MPNTPDIDVSALAEALNEKLDRDGGNATNAIKEMMAHMGMPSNRYIDLTLPADGGTVTAPDDGYIIFTKNAGSGTQYLVIEVSENRLRMDGRSNLGGNALSVFLPVRKGQTVTVRYDASGATTVFRFIYANGNQHLAS